MVEKCLHACTSERKAHHVSPSVTSVINSAPQNGPSWSHQGETESHHVIMHRVDREQAYNTPFIPLAHTKSSSTSVRSHKVKTAPLSERVIAVTTQKLQVVSPSCLSICFPQGGHASALLRVARACLSDRSVHHSSGLPWQLVNQHSCISLPVCEPSSLPSCLALLASNLRRGCCSASF